MLNFERLHQVIYEELGECGYKAIQSVIEHYFGNCSVDGWGCEEDKLLLLMYLYSGQLCISFDCKYDPDQEAAE